MTQDNHLDSPITLANKSEKASRRRNISLAAALLVIALVFLVLSFYPPLKQKFVHLLGVTQEAEHDSTTIKGQIRTIPTTKNADSTLPVIPSVSKKADASLSAEENSDLVRNLGFSPADTSSSINLGKPAQNYCLGSTKELSNPVSITQACKRISDRLASVSMQNCNAALLEPSQCHSVDGFPILTREFPPLEGRKPQGRILVIGGTHGDELTSVSITFRWIEKLNTFHSGLFHWLMVPMMNPDGVLNKEAQRTNVRGVDLNRNLPSNDWDENAHLYWRTKHGKNPRRYPGETPASEPETQWLIDQINNFKPDAIISIHAPYGIVDFDSLLLNTAPKSLGKLHLNLLGTYPGSLGNYAGINLGIPVITLELPHAWVMPSHQESTKIWVDIVSWLKKNIGEQTSP